MKKRSLLVLALVAIVAGLYVSTTATAANVVKRLQGGYVMDALQTLGGGIKIGSTGTTILNSYEACDCTVDNGTCGTWSSRATSTSTKANITVTGAAAGDGCVVVLGPTVAVSVQALAYNCEVSATNTATLHITNASGGTLTPTAGKRCVRTFSP